MHSISKRFSTAALAGVEQQREREAWLAANRVMRLELCDLVIGPAVKALRGRRRE